jgi:hypothetical protein
MAAPASPAREASTVRPSQIPSQYESCIPPPVPLLKLSCETPTSAGTLAFCICDSKVATTEENATAFPVVLFFFHRKTQGFKEISVLLELRLRCTVH